MKLANFINPSQAFILFFIRFMMGIYLWSLVLIPQVIYQKLPDSLVHQRKAPTNKAPNDRLQPSIFLPHLTSNKTNPQKLLLSLPSPFRPPHHNIYHQTITIPKTASRPCSSPTTLRPKSSQPRPFTERSRMKDPQRDPAPPRRLFSQFMCTFTKNTIRKSRRCTRENYNINDLFKNRQRPLKTLQPLNGV